MILANRRIQALTRSALGARTANGFEEPPNRRRAAVPGVKESLYIEKKGWQFHRPGVLLSGLLQGLGFAISIEAVFSSTLEAARVATRAL